MSTPNTILRRGQIPLSMALLLAAGFLIAVTWWTIAATSTKTSDGRQTIIFWGGASFGEDIYTVIHQFELKNPEYKVVMSTAAARDPTGDNQRLLCAISGKVPPDVVYFDRFAIGEWAARGAFEDLTPLLANQLSRESDPNRIELGEYYPFAVAEASFAPPGSNQPPHVYGIPTSTDVRVLYSNADLLRQAGKVDKDGNPQPPRNWDELRAYAKDLSRWDDKQNLTRLGFAPLYGNSFLYIYAWQAAGEMMDPSRTRITMDAPPNVRALRFITDIDDSLGGAAKVDGFQKSFGADVMDPFLRGHVVIKIDGDWSMEQIADWKRDMNFIVTPAPMPADQIAVGRAPVTWAGGWSLVIPTTAHNKAGAFKLIQYLSSWETTQLLEQGKRERKESEGKLYLPRARANKVQYERLIEEHVKDNHSIPQPFQDAVKIVQEMLPNTHYRPVTPVGQLLWRQVNAAVSDARNHNFRDEAAATGHDEIRLALARNQGGVQKRLDQLLRPAPPTQVNWSPVFAAYFALTALPFLAIYFAYKRNRHKRLHRPREIGAAMLFASPWTIGFIVLVGGPIIFSIFLSFCRYDVLSPARFVGLQNYRDVVRDPVFYKSLANTAFMIIRIPLLLIVSLMIALLLNRALRGIALYRTIIYLPAIMPLVASSLLWYWLLNPNSGAINAGLNWLFDTPPAHWIEWLIHHLGAPGFRFSAPSWLNDPLWSKPALILMNLWAAGGGMIIWLAGLQSIPQQLYEAAAIDGAGACKRFRHITLPMLSPYILFNLIIGLIGTLQIFNEAFIMTPNGDPARSTLFYAYHLFQQAFQDFNLGGANAMAFILFGIVLVLTLAQLWLSKKWVHYEQA